MENLSFFFGIYLLVWAFLVGFMVNTWMRQRRLERDIRKLKGSKSPPSESCFEDSSKEEANNE